MRNDQLPLFELPEFQTPKPLHPLERQKVSTRLDLTDGLRIAAQDMINRIPDLQHIKLERVHFAVFFTRKASRTLTYARCYPLTREIKTKGRRSFKLSKVLTNSNLEARYLLAFAWERYWEMTPRDRLETLIHELYHIGPKFDGEARAFATGGWHGQGRVWFDNIIHNLCEKYCPHGLEFKHDVLGLKLDPELEVQFDKLRLPRWELAVNK